MAGLDGDNVHSCSGVLFFASEVGWWKLAGEFCGGEVKRKDVDEFKDETTQSDSEVEITDLPPRQLSSVLEKLVALGSWFAHSLPKSHVWRLVTTGSAVALLLLMLLGGFPTIRNKALDVLLGPRSTLTANAPPGTTLQSAVAENSTLASLPLNCPSVAAPQNFDPVTFPPGVGASPIWITGLSGPPLLVHREDINPSQDYGWAYHVLLVVKSDYSDAVLLSGGSQHDDFPLLFDKEIVPQGQSPVTAFFQLNTQHPDFPSQYGDEHWKAWEIRLYVPSAGCYYLQAEWLGGSWKVNF